MSDTRKLCGNCEHWGTTEDAARNERYRHCQAVKHCGGDASFPDDASKLMVANHPGELAGTMDSSGYHSALVCRDDYGCVLFEPKETH